MILLDLAKAYQTPLTLVIVIFGPQLLTRGIRYLNNRNRPSPGRGAGSAHAHPSSSPALLTQVKAFLALHTLYHLLHLLLPPYDLFSTPHLPLLAPNDLLRSRLQQQGASSDDPLVDLLLTRLRDLDTRILYLRYGHNALQGCLWCRTPLDYFIAALPDMLARYVWAAIVVTCLGSDRLAGEGAGRRSKRWGSAAIWTISAACVAELGARYLWDLRVVKGDCLHLSHTIHYLRTALLLALPLLHTFLPAGPRSPNPAVLMAALQNARNTHRLTSLLRETVQQDEGLRETWTTAGRTERAVKAAARADPEVQTAIRDYNVAQGTMNYAGQWVEEGWNGILRIQADRPTAPSL